MNTPTYAWRIPTDNEGNKALSVRELAADVETTTKSLDDRVAAVEGGGNTVTFGLNWSSSTAYSKNVIVRYNSSFWIALAANTNSAPTSSNSNWAQWQALASSCDWTNIINKPTAFTPSSHASSHLPGGTDALAAIGNANGAVTVGNDGKTYITTGDVQVIVGLYNQLRLMNAAGNDWRDMQLGAVVCANQATFNGGINCPKPALFSAFFGNDIPITAQGTTSQSEPLLLMRQKSSTGTMRDAATLDAVVVPGASSDASFTTDLVLKNSVNGGLVEAGRLNNGYFVGKGIKNSAGTGALSIGADNNATLAGGALLVGTTTVSNVSVSAQVGYFGSLDFNYDASFRWFNSAKTNVDLGIERGSANVLKVTDANGGLGAVEASALILTAPNGSRWRVTINNDGSLSQTAL